MLPPLLRPYADRYLKRAGGVAMQRAARLVRDIVYRDALSMNRRGARPGWYHSLPAFKGEIHRAIEVAS